MQARMPRVVSAVPFAVALSAAIAASATVVRAQPQGAPPASPARIEKLDANTRREVLEALLTGVKDRYVEADTARMIADAVRKRAKAGAYDRLDSPQEFAEAVTRDLRGVNGDLHLSLRYDPERSGPLSGPMVVRRVTGGEPGAPASPGGRRVVVREGEAGGAGAGPRIVRAGGPGPGGPGGPGAEEAGEGPPPAFLKAALESNFGLTKVEVLPGNVGYLEISGFNGVDGSDAAVDHALRLLERTEAVIVDVRRNPGGSGIMSHYVFSHFLPEKPVETIRVKARDEGLSRTQESFAEVGGPRRPDVPLYVLTSRGTGSAAEEFSFVLKNLGRATLVGDRTAGAGHMVAGIPLPAGFVGGVSITRVSDPRTGAEWEGVGVQPDRRVPAERALAVAHAMALRGLAAKGDDAGRRTRLEMVADWVESKDHPKPVPAAELTAMVGIYEGDRRVENVDGKPMMRRGEGRPADELVPVGDGWFAAAGIARVRFAPGSPSPSITIERNDGSRGVYPRVESRVRD